MNRMFQFSGNWQRKVLIALCVILSVILIVLVSLLAYAKYLMNQINYVDPNNSVTMSPEQIEEYLKQTDPIDPNYTGPFYDATDITWGSDVDIQLPEQGDNIINILLIGQDSRDGVSVQRSDSMILCTINKSAKTITLTSFMRDLYVQIPGQPDHRLNSSYAWGGMNLLNATLKKNFGIEVDGNIEVNFYNFAAIVDIMGGLDVELTANEASYLNRRGNWDVNPDSAGTWNLTAGVNHLTGEQALAYSRIRDVGNSDFERTSRQRKVLTLMAEKVKTLNLAQLNSLMTTLLPMVTTDMTQSQIIGYVAEIFPMISELTISTMRVPEYGDFDNAYISGMSVLLPKLDKINSKLGDIMK